MKQLILLVAFCSPVYAGTITTFYSPLGSVTFSSNTATGPIALDTATYSAADASAGSPCTWNMTVGNGNASGKGLIVLACAGQGGVPVNLSAASFNGLALNKLQVDATGNDSSEIWYTTGPATGSHAFSVTPVAGSCGGGSNNSDCIGLSFVNVSQTSPVDISTGAVNSSAIIISSTGTLTGTTDVIVDVVNMGTTGSTISANTGQTGLSVLKNNSQGYTLGWSYKGPLTVGGSQFMTWTSNSAGTSLAQAVAAFQKAP